MALLEWNDALSTGITAADYEHRILIATVNRHHRAWVKEGRIGIAGLIDDLLRLFSTHFAIEERLMAEIAYRPHSVHEAHHRQAVAHLGEICVRAIELGVDPSPELGEGLQRWIEEHIRDHDVPLYQAVETEQARMREAANSVTGEVGVPP